MRNFTFDLISTELLEVFCAPRYSLHNPSFRPSNQQRTCFVHDYGAMEGTTGYWDIEEETGHGGFVHEFEDIFWVHDEGSDVWAARHVKGGRRLNKDFRKGKRKGARSGKGIRLGPSYEVIHKGKGQSKMQDEVAKKAKTK